MRRRSEELATGEWAALALVAEAPTHGFAVARAMAPGGEVGRVWAMRRPLVYRTLDVLVGLELIREAGTEPSTTGPRRTLLEVTPAGRERLERWLSTPVEHVRDARSDLMLKLLFLDRAGSRPGAPARRPARPLRRARRRARDRGVRSRGLRAHARALAAGEHPRRGPLRRALPRGPDRASRSRRRFEPVSSTSWSTAASRPDARTDSRSMLTVDEAAPVDRQRAGLLGARRFEQLDRVAARDLGLAVERGDEARRRRNRVLRRVLLEAHGVVAAEVVGPVRGGGGLAADHDLAGLLRGLRERGLACRRRCGGRGSGAAASGKDEHAHE